MRLALLAATEQHGAVPYWPGCSIVRRDWKKLFVLIKHDIGSVRPATYSVYVVWNESDRLDDLGTWQFHWGVTFDAAIAEYEECLAAGERWSVE